MVGNRYELPFNRSYLNDRVIPWNMKHRLSDLMRVLRRSVQLAGRTQTYIKSLYKILLTGRSRTEGEVQRIDLNFRDILKATVPDTASGQQPTPPFRLASKQPSS